MCGNSFQKTKNNTKIVIKVYCILKEEIKSLLKLLKTCSPNPTSNYWFPVYNKNNK